MTLRRRQELFDVFALERSFYVALARAFAGAVLFGLPLFMTMEMWSLGFAIDPRRLAFFLLIGFPVLWGLAWLGGFREDVDWRDALVDAGVAYLVGIMASAAVLAILAVLGPDMSFRELVGKVALQAVPAGMGAALARGQLGLRDGEDETEERRETYGGELFLMAAGALFLAFNVAPTEEVVLIAHQQGSPWYALAMMIGSVLVIHAFVYALGFRGQHQPREEMPHLVELLLLTLPAYALVLVVCLYVLWTFGRLDGLSPDMALKLVVVLGFPGALGVAAARLIL